MTIRFIDDLGEIHEAGAQRMLGAFQAAQGSLASFSSSAVNTAPEDIGWVVVHTDAQSGCMLLSFDARFVSDEALSTASSLLLSEPYPVIELNYKAPEKNREVYKEVTLACMRLMTVANSVVNEEQDRERYIAVAKDPNSLFSENSDAARQLRPILGSWFDNSGLYTDGVAAVMKRQGMFDRAVFIEPDPGYSEPKFTHIGDDIGVYGPEWPHQAVGNRVHQQPDPSYGEWVRKAYEVILKSEIPQYEHIDACMMLEGGIKCRNRYRCLRLPFKTQEGGTLLVGMSVMTPDVEISLTMPKSFKI